MWLLLHTCTSSLLQIEDALFLTKNSIRGLHSSYLCENYNFLCSKNNTNSTTDSIPPDDLDIDYPFTNVVNSVFPIDSVVSFNNSGDYRELVARYASFSPVLTDPLVSQYAIFPGDACEAITEPLPAFENRTLIVLRGNCKFVTKVLNLLNSPLSPRAVIVANDEPSQGLITMYSATFNNDGHLRTPVLFMLNENYHVLDSLKDLHLSITIRTAAFDNWINLLLSMAVSPPILILFCYLAVRGLQMFRKKRVNVMNEKLVRGLPVYIFNGNHLIPAKHFFEYLTATRQTGQISQTGGSSSSESLPTEPDIQENIPPSSLVVNGTDLYSIARSCQLLFSPRDFYPTFKCSICLDRFHTLKLRVLVLDCHHIFHEKCLANWLINFRTSCPLCNENLRCSDHHRLLSASYTNYNSIGDLEQNVGVETQPGESRSEASQPGESRNEASRSELSLTETNPNQLSQELTSDASVAALHSLKMTTSPPCSPHTSEVSTNGAISFYTSRSEPMTSSLASSSRSSQFFTPRPSMSSWFEEEESDNELQNGNATELMHSSSSAATVRAE